MQSRLASGAPATVPPGLLKEKVLAPEPPAGYVRRSSLHQSLEGLQERRLTWLQAPAEGVWATNIESMSNNVSALLAHYLAEAGRPDEAGEVWRDYGLPCGATELVDLERNRTRGIQQRTLKGLTHLRGTWKASMRWRSA